MVDEQTRGMEDQFVEQALSCTSALSHYIPVLIATTTIITSMSRQMTEQLTDNPSRSAAVVSNP